jgi:hypothetical protein
MATAFLIEERTNYDDKAKIQLGAYKNGHNFRHAATSSYHTIAVSMDALRIL